MALSAAAARNTYHTAYKELLNQGLLHLYRRCQRSLSPSRRSSRLWNCFSCSESARSNTLSLLPRSMNESPERHLHPYPTPRCSSERFSVHLKEARKRGRRCLEGHKLRPRSSPEAGAMSSSYLLPS